MHGRYSNIHSIIAQKGYEKIYTEYKRVNIRCFCKKYGISDNTAREIFGPKITKSKKRIIAIMKKEGEKGKIREIAGRNIL